jgi:hypothetical protein
MNMLLTWVGEGGRREWGLELLAYVRLSAVRRTFPLLPGPSSRIQIAMGGAGSLAGAGDGFLDDAQQGKVCPWLGFDSVVRVGVLHGESPCAVALAFLSGRGGLPALVGMVLVVGGAAGPRCAGMPTGA